LAPQPFKRPWQSLSTANFGLQVPGLQTVAEGAGEARGFRYNGRRNASGETREKEGRVCR
jgi:hypothetical protein